MNRINVPGSRLIVFVDETGDESLADPQYPVFGLAGCAMPASVYFGFVRGDWGELKAKHFGGKDKPLHAASIDPSNSLAVEAVADFFLSQHFSRFGATLSDLTVLAGLDPYELVAEALLERLRDVARYWSGFDGILFIMEQSHRGDPLATRYLTGWRYWREVDGARIEIPVQRHFMPKSAREPGLEIADFIAQALGASSRGFREKAQLPTCRRDFRATISDVKPRRLVSVVDIKAVNRDRSSAGLE